MREYLKRLPKETLNLVYAATDMACFNSVPAYLVGGFVRDLLLGVKNFDLDIVVEGDGIKFAEDLARHLRSKLISHRRFGTATVITRQNLKIDISSSRKESYAQPAQLPVVSKGGLKDDLFRRDFTINAMAIDIGCENFGGLIDYYGGKPDLKAKKIRILHGLSFRDDPTRILRAIRFEQRYGFKIEPATLKALKAAVKLRMLEKTEPQRLRDELILMLKEERPLKEIKRLQQLAGFSFLSPGLSLSTKRYAFMRSLGKEAAWFNGALDRHIPVDSWLLYLMALLEPLDTNAIKSIWREFAFRKAEEKKMLGYKGIDGVSIKQLKKSTVRPSRIFAILEPISCEAILLVKAKYRDAYLQRHIVDFFKRYQGMRIKTTGEDLQSLGLKPGPNFRKILRKLLYAKLDGAVKSKEDEILLIREWLKR